VYSALDYDGKVGVDELDESLKGQSSDISNPKLGLGTFHDGTLISN